METIRIEEAKYADGAEYQNLRPCHYFDFFVGTSTGGLIAVMLGRLRMSIDDCVKEYKSLGTLVFGRRRWRPWYPMTKYHDKYLEGAIKSVVIEHCKEHADDEKCDGETLLRQYDFSHRPGQHQNYTSKVALVACREKSQGGDDTYLFRSYDHVEADPTTYNHHDDLELNPARVQRNMTRIWEACRATSAAPLYFHKTVIEGARYMDGGVGRNNPAGLARYEALQMAERATGGSRNLLLLVSVGTGLKEEQSRFGTGYGPVPYKLMKWMKKAVTNTETTHTQTRANLVREKTPYFRFNVSRGLNKMKLDECKKEKIEKSEVTRLFHSIVPSKSSTAPTAPTAPAANGASIAAEEPAANDGAAPDDTPPTTALPVRSEASDTPSPAAADEAPDARASRDAKPPKGSYKPHKYVYTTYEQIEQDTIAFCNITTATNTTIAVARHLEAAAQFLVYYRKRRERDTDRWKKFSCHPYRLIEQASDDLLYD